MRYFVLFFCVVTTGCLVTKSGSLRKYSYFIVGFYDNSGNTYFSSGSGYFIKKDNDMFFITARHVLTGCSYPDTCANPVKSDVYPDIMKIYLTNDGDINYKYISIDIRQIKDTTPCETNPITPDIIAYKVVRNSADTIYSIENYLSNKLPKKRGQISIYGFPYKANIENGFFVEKNASHLTMDNYNFFNYYKFAGCGGKSGIDSMDYIIKPMSNLVYDSVKGYSGSPVFIRNMKNNQWVFIGTATGVVEKDKLALLKPEYSVKAINSQ